MEQLDKEDLKRKGIIEEYINNRTNIIIEKSIEELKEVSIIIKQLNNFIDGKLELSSNSIKIKIQRLIEHFTINLIYELDSNIAFRRARKFEEKTSITPYCFNELQDLSFIPDIKKSIIPLGRFNKKEESIYYASIHFEEEKEIFFSTAISEINSIKFDYINILDSIPTKRLNVVYIGVFDIFIRNNQIPNWVDKYYYDTYMLFKKKCIEKNNIHLFKSYILSNSFFADIIKRDGSERLYKVTSTISSILLENIITEAIVYESVKVKDTPVIAIKPNVINNHIKHKNAYSYKVKEDLGYGIYSIDKINECEIVNEELKWEKK